MVYIIVVFIMGMIVGLVFKSRPIYIKKLDVNKNSVPYCSMVDKNQFIIDKTNPYDDYYAQNDESETIEAIDTINKNINDMADRDALRWARSFLDNSPLNK